MSMEPEQPASEGTPSTTAPEKPNPFGRLIGVLFSPDETFASIARRPDWVVPLLLFMALALFGGWVFSHHVDFLTAARAQMEAQGRLTPEQIDRGLKFNAVLFKVISYLAPIVSVVIFTIVASLMMLAFRMMGGEGEFRQYFSVTLYAWVPQILQGLIIEGILLTRSVAAGAETLPTLLKSNLAFLVDMKEHAVLFSLLSSLDIFTIWSVILMAIGFAYVSRLSKGKSAGIVIVVWGFWVLLKTGGAALGSLMRARK